MTSPYINDTSISNPDQNKLIIVQAVSRTLSSLFEGVADASLKCMNYPGCIEQRGGDSTLGYIDKTLILIVKVIAVFTDTIAPVLEEAVFGDLANKPWPEVAPRILKLINDKKDFLDKMSRDPTVQQALKEWAEAYATVGIQTTEAIKPSLNLLIDEALSTLTQAGSRFSRGIINTTLDLTEAAVGEIPVAGGIIDVVLALIRGGNRALVSIAPLLQFGTETFGTVVGTANKVMTIAEKGKREIEDATQKIQTLTDKFKNIESLGANTLENIANIGQTVAQTALTNVAEKAVSNVAQTALTNVAQKALTNVAQKAVSNVAQKALTNVAQKAVNNMAQKAQTAVNNVALAQTALNNITQTGGRKHIKNKIKKMTKRIRNALNIFRGTHTHTRKKRVKKYSY